MLRVLRAALAGGVLVVALSIGFSVALPAPTAHAWGGGTPTPVDIGTVLKKVPAADVVKTGGKLSPWVRGANLLMMGLQLTDTIVNLSDQADLPHESEQQPGGEFVVNGQVGNCQFTATFKQRTDGQVESSRVGTGCGSGGTNVTVRIWCSVNPATIPSTVTHEYGIAMRDGPGGLQGNGCGVGVTLTGADIRPYNGATSNLAGAADSGYPAGQHETTTTVKCRQADGTTVTISDTLAGEPGQIAIPSCADRVPGSFPVEITADSGRAGTAKTRDYGVTTDYQNLLTKYPDCFSNGAMTCVVTIWINGRPCTAARTVCWDWPDALQTDPDANVDCRLSSYVIGIGNCDELKKSYDPKTGSQTVTKTKPDGSPEVVPKTPTNPNPSPSPSTPAEPSAPPTAGPNPETPPTNPDPETNPDSRSCYADMWSFNPIDWVYVPVKCVLIWAFVPKSWPNFGSVPNPLPPGWIPSFVDLPDGQCGVVTMPSLNLGNLLPATGARTLFDTCAQPWPLVRSVSYYGCLALGMVTVGNRAYRAVMTALGMAVEYSGSPGGDD